MRNKKKRFEQSDYDDNALSDGDSKYDDEFDAFEN